MLSSSGLSPDGCTTETKGKESRRSTLLDDMSGCEVYRAAVAEGRFLWVAVTVGLEILAASSFRFPGHRHRPCTAIGIFDFG